MQKDLDVSLYQDPINIYSNEARNPLRMEKSTNFILEFNRGIPLSSSNFSNRIKTLDYSFITYLKYVTHNLCNAFNIFLIILVIALFLLETFISHLDSLKLFYILVPYSFLFIIEFACTTLRYIKLYHLDYKINNQKCHIYDIENKSFVGSKWGDIRMGHIIKVEKNEIVPADVLLLEVSNSGHNCFIDTSLINGIFDHFSIKTACPDTQLPSMKKMHIRDYVQIIKGIIKYEEPNDDMQNFYGRIKMNSFPRASDVDIENFIMRGSVVKNVECIYCLVLYVGMYCRIYQNKKAIIVAEKDLFFYQYFLNSIKIIFCITMILTILNEFYKAILNYYLVDNEEHYYLHMENQKNKDIHDMGYINPFNEMLISCINHLYFYILIVPFTAFSLHHLAFLFLKLTTNNNIKNETSSKIQIKNSEVLPNFGQVKYIIAEKTGVLSKSKFVLKLCSIQGNLYSFTQLNHDKETFIFNMLNEIDNSNVEMFHTLFNKESIESEKINEFFAYLLLCNSIKYTDDGKVEISKSKVKTIFIEDSSILSALQKIGYKISITKKREFTITLGDKEYSYVIIGRNLYSSKRKRVSVIVKNLNTNKIFLICKSSDMSILTRLNPREKVDKIQKISEQIYRLSSFGMHYAMIFRKELTLSETSRFNKKQRQASNFIIQKEAHLEQLANEYETDLEYFGTLFYEEKVPIDQVLVVSHLIYHKVHLWIASGDHKKNVLSIAMKLKLYNPNSLIAEFGKRDLDEDDLYSKMNLYLMQFLQPGGNKIFRIKTKKGVINFTNESTKNFGIVIHGDSFAKILSDKLLLQRFVVLLSYCSFFFGHCFTAEEKSALAKLVKKYIAKNSIVLGIGNGYDDYKMLRECDLAAMIRKKFHMHIANICDVTLEKFSQIYDLIIINGTLNYKTMKNIFFFSLYSNMLFIATVFFHQNSCPFGSAFFYEKKVYVLCQLVSINVFIILIFAFDNAYERSLINISGYIYQCNFYDKEKILFELYSDVIKSLAESILVYNILTAVRNYSTLNGSLSISDNMVFGQLVTMIIITIIHMKILLFKLNMVTMLSLIFVLISYIISLVIQVSQKGFGGMMSIPGSPLIFLLSVSICFLYEYTLKCLRVFTQPDIATQIRLIVFRYINGLFSNFGFKGVIKRINEISSHFRKKLNQVSFPEVLANLSNNKQKVDSTLENMADVTNELIAHSKIIIPFLNFNDKIDERDYIYNSSSYHKSVLVCYILLNLVFMLATFLLEFFYSKIRTEVLVITSVDVAISLLSLVFFCKVSIKLYSIFLIIAVVGKAVSVYIETEKNDSDVCFNFYFISLFSLYIHSGHYVIIMVIIVLYSISTFPSLFISSKSLILVKVKNTREIVLSLPLIYNIILNILSSIILMIISAFNNELSSRVKYFKYKKCLNELKKDNDVFANLTPEFVQEKMSLVSVNPMFDYENVTIIFCDICDFDHLVETMSPKNLIVLLDNIYNTFDHLCIMHSIQKIETVGKTYMAAGGIRQCEMKFDELDKHHSVRVFELAKDMIEAISRMTLENGEGVKVKVGIHYGRVIPAVVGSRKPQFSLIGDAVNVTSRMCSCSKENSITCSENAYEKIKSTYNNFECFKKEIKGKGEMNVYTHNPFKNEIFDCDVVGCRVMSTSPRLVSPLFTRSKSFYDESSRCEMESGENNNSLCIHDSDSVEGRRKTLSRKLRVSKKNTNTSFGNKNDDKNPFRFSFLFLCFKDKEAKKIYQDFEEDKVKKSYKNSMLMNIIFIVTYSFNLYDITQMVYLMFSSQSFLILADFFIIVLFIPYIYNTHYLIKRSLTKFRVLTFFYFSVFLLKNHFHFYIFDEKFSINFVLIIILVLTTVTFNNSLNFPLVALILIEELLFSGGSIIYSSSFISVKYNIYIIIISLGNLLFKSILTSMSLNERLQILRQKDNLSQSEQRLFNLMPPHVIQNLKDANPVADIIYKVTLLYADIVKFTDYSSNREPVDIVHLLTDLFDNFDKATEKYNVYKVHTIGDCYVVMGFTGKVSLDQRNYAEEAKNVLMMGKEMRNIIKVIREAFHYEHIDMRIGIHTGTVIGGVIGTQVVRYDIFGADVLTANKMESYGMPGKINVSEDTKNFLVNEDVNGEFNGYVFEENKSVFIPAINKEVKMFFVEEEIKSEI